MSCSKFPCTITLDFLGWLEEECNTSITKSQRSSAGIPSMRCDHCSESNLCTSVCYTNFCFCFRNRPSSCSGVPNSVFSNCCGHSSSHSEPSFQFCDHSFSRSEPKSQLCHSNHRTDFCQLLLVHSAVRHHQPTTHTSSNRLTLKCFFPVLG